MNHHRMSAEQGGLAMAPPGSNGCIVLSGILTDPYTGQTLTYARGPNPPQVSVDHVVALADAWTTGAQQLTPQRRRNLAGDPMNLLAVSAAANSANSAKADRDAAEWVPVPSFQCGVVARQIAVKQRYTLWVTPAEKAAMTKMLTGCPNQPLPTR